MPNNTDRPLKALCLAAGFATRLRPFSETIPKAAMPIMGIPSLNLALKKIEALGVNDIAVNAHHLAPAVQALVADYQGNANIELSYEPEILGSGGALVPLRKWLGNADLLIVNPDVVTDLDIEAFIRDFRSQQCLVSIAVVEHHPHGLAGSVWNDNGSIKKISRDPYGDAAPTLRAAYGVGVFAVQAAFIDYLPRQGFANLTEAMNAAIDDQKRVRTFVHAGYFADFGESIASYIQVHKDLLADGARLFHALNLGDLLAEEGRELLMALAADGTIQGCIESTVMEPGTEVAEESRDFFVFAPTRLEGDCLLNNCILSSAAMPHSGDVLNTVAIDVHHVTLE